MAVAKDAIKIDGLREFQASLKAMDGQSQKMLRLVLNEGSKIIAESARPKVPKRTGRAAASLRPSSSQRVASVSAGSARVPYYAWLDFGGSVGRNDSVHRPFFKEGRYLFVAWREKRADVEKKMAEGLTDLIERSGLEAS